MTTGNRLRFKALLCGLFLSLMSGAGFAATNLLTNPSFDSGIAGWTLLTPFTAEWSTVDVSGNTHSGSALVVNEMHPSNGFVPLVMVQCAVVAPLTDYSFGGRLLIPAGQPAGTAPQLWALAYASGDCSGGILRTVQEHPTTVGQWVTVASTIATPAGAHSVRLALGVFKPAGETADASTYYDNLYLQQGAGGQGFAIGPSLSASWYNPAQSGHGITLELLDSSRAWMCWFTFDLAGNRAWICGQGGVGGVTITFANAFTVEGGNFPPAFDPQKIVHVPWGTITLTFTGCDTATMTWSTAAPGFQSGSIPLSRLTTLWGNPCQ